MNRKVVSWCPYAFGWSIEVVGPREGIDWWSLPLCSDWVHAHTIYLDSSTPLILILLGGAPESFPQSPCLFYLGAFLDKMVWFYLGYTDLRPLLGTNAAKQAGYLSFFSSHTFGRQKIPHCERFYLLAFFLVVFWRYGTVFIETHVIFAQWPASDSWWVEHWAAPWLKLGTMPCLNLLTKSRMKCSWSCFDDGFRLQLVGKSNTGPKLLINLGFSAFNLTIKTINHWAWYFHEPHCYDIWSWWYKKK